MAQTIPKQEEHPISGGAAQPPPTTTTGSTNEPDVSNTIPQQQTQKSSPIDNLLQVFKVSMKKRLIDETQHY